MVEDITEEQLQKIINEYVPEGSSVGIHGIDKSEPSKIAELIIEEGLIMSKHHSGLTGTIEFLNINDSELCSDILSYSYGTPDNEGNRYTIVCVIPQIIKDANGISFYLGHYSKFDGLGKDDYQGQSLPTHDIKLLPKEFVLGCVISNIYTRKNSFAINSKFIALQNDEYIDRFNQNFLDMIRKDVTAFSLDDAGYNKALCRIKILSKEDPFCYYTKSFIQYYEELQKNKER